MSNITGTGNWTSHCGADFSFLDAYLREKQMLPSIRRSTRQELNQGVLTAYEYIQDVHRNREDAMLDDMNREITDHNDRVYAKHNINPNDGIPAYVDVELQQPITTVSTIGQQVLEDERQFYLSELYDAVRKDGLDSYLSDDVMQVLNSDSFSYRAYDERQSLAEYHEQERLDKMKANRMSMPNRNYSKGFEMDDAGNLVDDGYGFDEYD